MASSGLSGTNSGAWEIGNAGLGPSEAACEAGESRAVLCNMWELIGRMTQLVWRGEIVVPSLILGGPMFGR